MFNTSIKLKKTTWQRAKRCAKAAGYASVEEFVEHVLEKELRKFDDAKSDDEIVKKLRGLGYLE
ncbi:MAG TPA: hypothetical protein VMG40_01905 [Bryobacteraceae bacterium]|nr:hypothetical protein [Bryobacteraceae bacterium]